MAVSIGKAWGFGGVIVLITYIAWFVSLWANKFSEVLVLLLWVAPAVAAFVTAYCAPCRRVLLGGSIALLAAILAGMLNFTYEALGHTVDFPGIRGAAVLAAITLVFNGVTCTIGAACGYFLAQKSMPK